MDMPDSDGYEIKEWETEPGDVIAFNFKTVHGANANKDTKMSRTLSFRLLGDDVVYNERPGRTSPSFPGINQQNGERLREDWFPTLWSE
jgi:ectoine hydroxylase-related dioxygenase (phytanoyl-CoA dioxygenase family)